MGQSMVNTDLPTILSENRELIVLEYSLYVTLRKVISDPSLPNVSFAASLRADHIVGNRKCKH